VDGQEKENLKALDLPIRAFLFNTIYASGGQLFEKSWTKTFQEAAARHF